MRPGVDAGGESTLAGEVTRVADRGRRYDVTVRLPSGESLVVERRADPPTVGETLGVEVPVAKLTLFGADTEPTLPR